VAPWLKPSSVPPGMVRAELRWLAARAPKAAVRQSSFEFWMSVYKGLVLLDVAGAGERLSALALDGAPPILRKPPA
jgi:hypothetical protein